MLRIMLQFLFNQTPSSKLYHFKYNGNAHINIKINLCLPLLADGTQIIRKTSPIHNIFRTKQYKPFLYILLSTLSLTAIIS